MRRAGQKTPWFYHASEETLQRRGLNLPAATLSVEEQRARARETYDSLESAKPRPAGLLDFIGMGREDAGRRAARIFCEVHDRWGKAAFCRGGPGGGGLPGPLADRILELARLIVGPVPRSERTMMFWRVEE